MARTTLQPSWVQTFDPTVKDSTTSARQTLRAIEQARADQEDRKTRRAKEALDFVVGKLSDEARLYLSHAVRLRKSAGTLDATILATARLLLGPDGEQLLRQAKQFAAQEARS